jgi:hypothetical protein
LILKKILILPYVVLLLGWTECRVLVEDSIYDEFVERSVERAKKRTVGNPFQVVTNKFICILLSVVRVKRVNFRKPILDGALIQDCASPPPLFSGS